MIAYNGLQHVKWVRWARVTNLVFLEIGNDSFSVMLAVMTESNRQMQGCTINKAW